MEEIVLPAILNTQESESHSPLEARIRKKIRHLLKWAKRTKTNCFRIYDWEIGKYPLAIDYYAGRYCVQYFSRSREHPDAPDELFEEVNKTLHSIFGASEEAIYWRNRIRRTRMQQYEKAAAEKDFFQVFEYGVKFYINLTDYLDTGLFLDHRETRRYIASVAKGKRLLNLFAYTCSFSVHAAASGASFTKSVDMSNTYTDWGRENFLLNGLSSQTNPIIRADCLKFLEEEVKTPSKYDLIVIDPPTISRSKKMDQMFDIQIDYPFLISSALKLLAPGGAIYFSTNSRKFTFDSDLFPNCKILDVSSKTLPLDFHDRSIHKCWRITF